MQQADILIHQIHDHEKENKFFLSQLPKELREINSRFIRMEDRCRHSTGKYLLKTLLGQHGFSQEKLNSMDFGKSDKPFIPGTFHFNISHSGEMVVCAASMDCIVGIDVEHIHKVNIKLLQTKFTPNENQIINSSDDPMDTFFEFWSRKESVIKADGRGISMGLQKVDVSELQVRHPGKESWFLFPLNIKSDYKMCLCANNQNISIRMEWLKI